MKIFGPWQSFFEHFQDLRVEFFEKVDSGSDGMPIFQGIQQFVTISFG